MKFFTEFHNEFLEQENIFFQQIMVFIFFKFLFTLFYRFTILTFWRRNYFLNFSTPCVLNVNKTGTKHIRIVKQTAF